MPSQKHSSAESIPHSLAVIARNATGQIVTRITSNRDLLGAMNTARCVLPLKPGTVRAEVHYREGPMSDYREQPLAALSHEDLPVEGYTV